MFVRVQTSCLIVAMLLVAAAETCSFMLWLQPASATLWWLSLDVFGSLRGALDRVLADARFGVATSLLALFVAVMVLARRWPLGLAILSNAAFVLVLFAMASQALADGRGLSGFIRLGAAALLLLLALGLAFAASHVGYWRRIAGLAREHAG